MTDDMTIDELEGLRKQYLRDYPFSPDREASDKALDDLEEAIEALNSEDRTPGTRLLEVNEDPALKTRGIALRRRIGKRTLGTCPESVTGNP